MNRATIFALAFMLGTALAFWACDDSDLGDIAFPPDFDLIEIPSGEFVMGSRPRSGVPLETSPIDRNAPDDERPQFRVYLDTFQIARYEVTNAQYALFLDAIRATEDSDGNRLIDLELGYIQMTEAGRFNVQPLFEDHPARGVTWHGANAYIDWLNDVTGAGYRLPTEAEWEKAARGTDARLYPWGNDFGAFRLGSTVHANTEGAGVGDTSPVGSYPGGASPYGAMDMAGNVDEWTQDRFAEGYDANDDWNPVGPQTGDERVLRGGSWMNTETAARCAARAHTEPSKTLRNVGFRIAK